MKLDPTKIYEEFQGFVSEEEIREFMVEEGIRLQDTPDGDDWPKYDNLADMNGHALAEYLNILTAWLTTRLHEYKIINMLIRNISAIHRDYTNRVYMSKQGSPKDRQCLTEMDPTVRRYAEMLNEALNKKDAKESELEALKKYRSAVSRIISIYESEAKFESRNMNVGNRTYDQVTGTRED